VIGDKAPPFMPLFSPLILSGLAKSCTLTSVGIFGGSTAATQPPTNTSMNAIVHVVPREKESSDG
jgi:hypothetical protein